MMGLNRELIKRIERSAVEVVLKIWIVAVLDTALIKKGCMDEITGDPEELRPTLISLDGFAGYCRGLLWWDTVSYTPVYE
ncbi:hypothetical protein VNI00_000460 [Paramarasmius palmivorus]|uniref:Uncharacterized protein n=1 Tax=Paramarasmius palmivorus TaxID=297713 RepID=A0AAW0E853_9AGAR